MDLHITLSKTPALCTRMRKHACQSTATQHSDKFSIQIHSTDARRTDILSLVCARLCCGPFHCVDVSLLLAVRKLEAHPVPTHSSAQAVVTVAFTTTTAPAAPYGKFPFWQHPLVQAIYAPCTQHIVEEF